MTPLQAGSVVVAYVNSRTATWSCLILLLSIHLAMNHAAVRAVSMHTLNRQRANLVMSTLLDEKRVLKPPEVSAQERIFERDGVLRWRGSSIIGTAKIGIPLQAVIAALGRAHPVTGSVRSSSIDLEKLVDIYLDEDYILWYENSRNLALIVLKDGAPPVAQLKAWSHALLMAHRPVENDATSAQSAGEVTLLRLAATLRDLSTHWVEGLASLKAAGWELDAANLETTSATRIRLRLDS